MFSYFSDISLKDLETLPDNSISKKTEGIGHYAILELTSAFRRLQASNENFISKCFFFLLKS